jgi:molecular chaperone GrpE
MEKTISGNEPKPTDDKVSEANAGVADNLPEAAEAVGATENDPESELTKLRKELAEQKDKYLRLYSEFDNFRRRTSKERLELTQSANEQLLKVLLPVVDDFERAEKSFKDKNAKDLEGFFLIQNKFKKLLEQSAVKVMDIKSGADFNPDLHEAITQIPVTDEKLKGKVVDVVEKGYLLNDKVIRFAKVVVGA